MGELTRVLNERDAELLRIACAECKAGDLAGVEHYRKAAEAMSGLCNGYIPPMRQSELAKAIGRSQGYVSKLLRWYRSGCNGSPFQHTKEDNESRLAAKATRTVKIRATKAADYSPANNPTAPAPEGSSAVNYSLLVAAFDQRFHKMNAGHRADFVAYVLANSRTKVRAA